MQLNRNIIHSGTLTSFIPKLHIIAPLENGLWESEEQLIHLPKYPVTLSVELPVDTAT